MCIVLTHIATGPIYMGISYCVNIQQNKRVPTCDIYSALISILPKKETATEQYEHCYSFYMVLHCVC